MLRLLPYSIYEKEPLEAYLQAYADRGWQFSWRFFSILSFRKAAPSGQRVEIVYKNLGKPGAKLLHRGELDDHVFVRLRGADEESKATEDEAVRQFLYRETRASLIGFLALFAANLLLIFLYRWEDIQARAVFVSIYHLPKMLFFAVCAVFLFVRLLSLKQAEKHRTNYRARKRTALYLAVAVCILLILAQCFAIDPFVAQNETFRQMRDCLTETAGVKDVYTAAQFCILEPATWKMTAHASPQSMRMDYEYHRCATKALAGAYFQQFLDEGVCAQPQEAFNGGSLYSKQWEGGFQLAFLRGNEIYFVICNDCSDAEKVPDLIDQGVRMLKSVT